MEISEKTIEFITEHSNDDINELRLKYSGKSHLMDFPIEFALLQIEARRKSRKKIPTFLENRHFIFPDTLASEQASNEAIARFHASLIPSGSSVLDLTAGLGIDDLTFAKHGLRVTACEINYIKAEALSHNAEILGLKERIAVANIDSLTYLSECDRHFDVVFADPARRSDTGKRLHALSDCQPDILRAMGDIFRISDRLLVKSSPLLDLTFIKETVENLSKIYVVCLKGECKEVLLDIDKGKGFSGIKVIDMDMEHTISTFEYLPYTQNEEASIPYASRNNPSEYRYIYEPNAGIMKTGAWKVLTGMYPDLRKASSNTHLFLSDSLIDGFPGRVLAIRGQPDKKGLRLIRGGKYNVVARNYPLSAQEVAKKYSITPGGPGFLYAFKYKEKPVFLFADPVSQI